MIKDTSLSTELTFAILPVVMPINPRSGKIVKATKKVEDSTEDPEIVKNKELEGEIDPRKKYIVKEKLGVFILENEIKSAFNSSGYYIFLNLPRPELPQPIGHTLFIESDSYLSLKNFIDMDQFNSDSANKSIVAKSIVAYLFKKELLKNTNISSRFIKSIIIYPSKKTILEIVLNKAKTSEIPENHLEKPILDAEVRLRKFSDREDKLTPNSVSSNRYTFSSFDEIAQIEIVEGTYDESPNSILGERKFIKFPNQKEAKFELVVKQDGSSEDSTANKFPLEVKIEKAMITSINVLILE
jgi:hypothetical protein